MPFRLKDFAFFYSLQVGVVVFSVLGMVIHTVALLKYLHSSVTETSPKNTVYQYVISLIFIALGLAIYILGLTGSALEESKIVRVGGSLLVVEFVYWIILMGMSFSGVCLLTRRVCVDNRCPERLYIQNGYWRPTVYECNATDNDTAKNAEPDEKKGAMYVDLNGNVTEVGGLENSTLITVTDPNSDQGPSSTDARDDNFRADEDEDDGVRADEDEDDGNHSLWSPIGDMKTTPHFALSVVSAVLIFLFWYLYPIWLFFSFATQLDLDER